MPGYTVRAACLEDLEAVYAVFSLADRLHCRAHPDIFQAVDDPVGVTRIKDYFLAAIRADEAAVFVAETRRGIIGAVIAWVRPSREIPQLVQRLDVSVDNLVVAEEFRKQGVGRALMERVHLWANELGINHIELTVWDFNEGAQAFYQKMGYQMLYHRMRVVLS